jgi:hypothetical protein
LISIRIINPHNNYSADKLVKRYPDSEKIISRNKPRIFNFNNTSIEKPHNDKSYTKFYESIKTEKQEIKAPPDLSSSSTLDLHYKQLIESELGKRTVENKLK